jgi:hypothetical protein
MRKDPCGTHCVEDFADDLARAERSLLTIKNYCGDLRAFATWFRHANGEELTPTHIDVSANHVHGFGRFNLQNAEARPHVMLERIAPFTTVGLFERPAEVGQDPQRQQIDAEK